MNSTAVKPSATLKLLVAMECTIDTMFTDHAKIKMKGYASIRFVNNNIWFL